MEKLAHIYTGRNYSTGNIFLHCKKEWVKAESIGRYHTISGRKFWNHKHYEINGVKQWSLGAGHNSTCEDCLILYGKNIAGKSQKLFTQLEKIIKEKNEEIERLKNITRI